MKPPPQPANEALRLEVLRKYGVLDTSPEPALDDLTALAAHICGAPISLISLVDERRQWFKSKVGWTADETERDVSFCGHAILGEGLMVVPDTAQDERFVDNPLVIGEPRIRFYVGAPLLTHDGHAIGSLCVLDHVPRHLDAPQLEALRVLGRQVVSQLELRRQARELAESQERLRIVTDNARVGLVTVNRERRYVYANSTYAEILGLSSAEIVGHSVPEVLGGIYNEKVRPRLDRAFAGERVAYELCKRGAGGVCHYAVGYEPLQVSGVTQFVVVVITDITERKQAVAESERQRAELQFIMDAVPALVFYKDREGRFLRVNRELARLVGAAPEEFIGKTDCEMGAPEGVRYREDDLQVIGTGEPIRHLEEQIQTAEGPRWLLTDKIPYRDEAGHITGVIGFAVDITERKFTKMAALRLAAIVESSDDCIIGKDLSSIITSWNRGAEKIFGYTAEEMVGSSIMRLIPADRHDEEVQIIGKIRRGESVEHFETLRLTKSGRLIDVSVTASPIRDAGGGIIGVSKVARDITERKRAAEVLRWRTAFFEAQVDSSPDAVLVVDRQNRIILRNERLDRLFKVPKEIAEDDDDFKLLRHVTRQARDPEQFTARVMHLYEHPDETGLDEIELVDGTFLDRYSAPVRDKAGVYYGRIWTFRDITERRRTEARFRRLVDSNAQGVMFWNARGEITGANDAFLGIVGYEREDLKAGRIRWAAITPSGSEEFDRRHSEAVAADGFCAPYERELIRKDGVRVPALIGAAAFEDNREEGVCFVLDLTERKKLEAKFLRAQRMESIGTLAGGIAHDLNNVFAPILMSFELLKEMARDEADLSLLATIQGSAQRGADLVAQVLSFARGVQGKRVHVNLLHILRELTNVMRDTFPKSIQVCLGTAPGLWSVSGDPTQIHQIFLNLCVNARDAMPTGGTLGITLENVVLDETYTAMTTDSHPGPYVMVRLQDTGMGIAPEIQDRIFEPFFTTKGVGKGTGLGLATTLGIIRSHGGFINVYSEVGKGTKFKVYLPAEATQAEVEEEATGRTPLPRGNGELILVVDDEAAISRIVQSTLERFGYRVVQASNGVEALAVYREGGDRIAVVLTDMAMPLMDGPALILALMEINPRVRIIGSSGLASNGGVARAMGAGVRHFVPKPYTAGVMLKVLREILEGSSEGPVK